MTLDQAHWRRVKEEYLRWCLDAFSEGGCLYDSEDAAAREVIRQRLQRQLAALEEDARCAPP